MEADNAGSKLLAERKLTEDCALPIAELAESEAIGCLHLARIESRYLAIVIASYCRRPKSLKPLERLAWP